MGLLTKASLLSNDKKLAFSDFIISHNIHAFAVFKKQDNFYSIVNSIGFDGASLLSSLSTVDFWNGICLEESKVYDYDCENKSLNPMLQFFSFEMLDELKSVSLYKKDDFIYMLCNKQFENKIINDLSLLDFNFFNIDLNEINKTLTKDSKLLKFQVSFKEAVASYLSIKVRDDENIETFRHSITNELINRFSTSFSKFSTILENDEILKILININKSIQEEHLICHIVYSLRKVIGHSAELISFTSLGQADSINEVKDFLKVE